MAMKEIRQVFQTGQRLRNRFSKMSLMEQMKSEKFGPLAIPGSDRIGPDRIGSDRIGSDRIGSVPHLLRIVEIFCPRVITDVKDPKRNYERYDATN